MPDVTSRQLWRPSVARTLLVLLLVFVFCVSAMAAGGVFDQTIDPTEATTRILTPEEAQHLTEDAAAAAPGDERAAPVALIAALLLTAGGLLISLALPTRAERRRTAAETRIPPPVASTVTRPPPRREAAPVSRFGAPCPAAVAPGHRPLMVPAPLPAAPSPAEEGPRRVGARKPPPSDGPDRRMAVVHVR